MVHTGHFDFALTVNEAKVLQEVVTEAERNEYPSTERYAYLETLLDRLERFIARH